MGNSSSAGDVFDIKRVRRLIELMKENDLTELDIQQGDMRIELKRHSTQPVQPVLAGTSIATPVVHATPAIEAAPALAPIAPVEEENVHLILSPMVGTFYAASSPESPAFVKIGDAVSPDSTVCLVEAMKVYNEIQAECTGVVVAILVKNGETVEYGKPLFKVKV